MGFLFVLIVGLLAGTISGIVGTGSSIMFGSFIAKRFVLKLEPDVFRLIMDAIMLAAGAAMLGTAATA